VLVGIVSVNLPFVTLTVESVIEGIDSALGEAAASLGATPFTAWRLVTLPLALPGLLAAGALSFILTMNAYATPVLLGGPQFVMMAPLVYVQFAGKSNWPFGAAVSFILMATTLILTAVANLMVQRRYRN
jgi:putative spermidine/putrescine transport system permease protein